jgi:phospholipid transport system transporter-binding protein
MMTAIIENASRWEISGDIGMDNANSLLVASKTLMLADGAEVDFGKVGEVDTSAVSLMLEWRRRALSENKKITFVNLPKSLISLMDLYGVTALID